MKVLLLYPEFPDTFWSYKHALSFVGKRGTFPPLGLLTVAGMLPPEWEVRLVDLNVGRLRARDLAWADMAFVSGMIVQRDAAKRLVGRCKEAGLTVVGGGPLFTMEHEEIAGVDHVVLNEAELTFPRFLADWQRGEAKPIYAEEDVYADMAVSPLPRWELADRRQYHSMALQYSRGCPFDCDFCNITSLLGHKVRTKTTEQVVRELDAMSASGWRGNVFFVDDNFIGNKRHLKTDLLPRLAAWRADKPGITFQTEASINLADDGELMDQMVAAGFDTVFVGIETPESAALAECNKTQNEHRDLVADVKRMQRAGLQVQGGFIVGFDSDGPSVFRRQIDFIQNSGIATAMVGLLQAPKGTRLYRRMEEEGRLCGSASGDNVEGTTNIVPRMDLDLLHRGYREILRTIYAPRPYYQRVRTLLREFRCPRVARHITLTDLAALWRSVYRLGLFGCERLEYWKLLAWTLLRRPTQIPLAVTLAISGHHFRKVCEQHIR